jgi:hypothetical protein
VARTAWILFFLEEKKQEKTMLSFNRPKKPTYQNRGRKLLGQKPPLKLKEIWAIRIRLQLAARLKDLALFNPAIDSKLRGCYRRG